jgi:hypothetical protein
MKSAFLLLAAAPAMWAQASASDAVLERARDRILEAIHSLPKYICTQTVDRAYLAPTQAGMSRGGCDQIVANRQNGTAHMLLQESDRLRLDVEVADEGFEIYSWPGASRISTERVQDLVGGGSMGTGPFGPFLIDIFDNHGVDFVGEGEKQMDGRGLQQYRFYVPEKLSHYRVQAAGSTRVAPYEGRFWLDPASGDLARLTVRVGELSRSTGNCEATTAVDFARAHIGAGEYLLPRKSLLRIVRRDAAEQSNTTTYASCREFHGDVTVRYDDIAPEDGANAAAATPTRKGGVPPGLPVNIALETEVNTDTAAAGDQIMGRILQPIVERRSKRTIAPAGAAVRGRITHLMHHTEGEPYFAISIVWEGLQADGKWLPFAALLDRPATVLESKGARQDFGSYFKLRLEARRAFPTGSTFVFETSMSKYVMPRGYTAAWITAVPQADSRAH